MAVEIESEFGGCNASFTSAILVVEEIAKVDPSVAVLVDVHVRGVMGDSLIGEYFGEYFVQKVCK